jgi:hypothetical protein
VAPEGSPERVAARHRLTRHAAGHRFIGYTSAAWVKLVHDHYANLVEIVGDEDVQHIANAAWSSPR